MFDINYVASFLFACAVLHSFSVKFILTCANRFPEGSILENFLHLLGEIEVVFGLWASIFILYWTLLFGRDSAAQYLQGINYTEAAFVFVIMCMAATRPVLSFTRRFIAGVAGVLPFPPSFALYCSSLIIGPLLGSLITEPAAMTVTAILLRDRFFGPKLSLKFRYATIGLLFVNVSIGGSLTHFAAPPVLIVAKLWNWDTPYMLTHFGWRAALSVIIGSVGAAVFFRKELRGLDGFAKDEAKSVEPPMPPWIIAVHLGFLLITIINAHSMAFFIGGFLLFLGWCSAAQEYQDELRIKESLLVAYFLGGLVTLGKLQDWWLQPLLAKLDTLTLFWGSLGLTAVTDNAAITYLGTLVPGLSPEARFALVAGALAGGGLTVIANAPNPVGYGLLKESFGANGISPLALFLGALPFTMIVAVLFLV